MDTLKTAAPRPPRASVRPSQIGEPVAVPTMLNGYFPKAFVWRGRRHDVSAVEACRTEVRRDWRGLAERHHFRVRANGAVFELTQDLARDTWQLERMWERPATP